jgi:hypothetical protein
MLHKEDAHVSGAGIFNVKPLAVCAGGFCLDSTYVPRAQQAIKMGGEHGRA